MFRQTLQRTVVKRGIRNAPSPIPNLICARTTGSLAKSSKNDFRNTGTEKEAGALQDLLRRVMEIDAGITNTPVVDYKPNTLVCTAFCVADQICLEKVADELNSQKSEFAINTTQQYANMIHAIDVKDRGDVFIFDNGTLACWGLDSSGKELLLNSVLQRERKVGPVFSESTETAEYTIDEDEVTDMKGDIMILNPYIPSIELSKIAFSYGLGRVAKLVSIEQCVDKYLDTISTVPSLLCDEDNSHKLSTSAMSGRLLMLQKRMIQGSCDGFLGTSDLRWAKPELQGYVSKISDQFNVKTRIDVLSKKIEYAKDVLRAANEHCYRRAE